MDYIWHADRMFREVAWQFQAEYLLNSFIYCPEIAGIETSWIKTQCSPDGQWKPTHVGRRIGGSG